MDPTAALEACDQEISDGELSEAQDDLNNYREWRAKGGFEPMNVASSGMRGDRFADQCQRRIDDQLTQNKS